MALQDIGCNSKHVTAYTYSLIPCEHQRMYRTSMLKAFDSVCPNIAKNHLAHAPVKHLTK